MPRKKLGLPPEALEKLKRLANEVAETTAFGERCAACELAVQPELETCREQARIIQALREQFFPEAP